MIRSSLVPHHEYASIPEKLISTCLHYSPLKMGHHRAKVKTWPNTQTHTISKAEYISVIKHTNMHSPIITHTYLIAPVHKHTHQSTRQND